jgi:hypothetical protein
MDDFFKGLEKNHPEQKKEAVLKSYPSWVGSSKSPQLTQQYYDTVLRLYDESRLKIKEKKFSKASDVMLSQTKVCKELGKQRSALKNHPMITALIEAQNTSINEILENIKNEKSVARKTKSQIKKERDILAKLQDESLKADYEALLKAEMVITQADALEKIEQLKLELARYREENSILKLSNAKLQEDKRKLERRIFGK